MCLSSNEPNEEVACNKKVTYRIKFLNVLKVSLVLKFILVIEIEFDRKHGT